MQLNLHKCIFNIVQFLQKRLLFHFVSGRWTLVKPGVPVNDIEWAALRENFKSISGVARSYKILMLEIRRVD